MPETLQNSEINLPVTLEQHDSVEVFKASDILPSRADIETQIDNKTISGEINVFPVDSARSFDGDVISATVEYSEDDFPENSGEVFNELPSYLSAADIKSRGVTDNPQLDRKEAEAVREALVDDVISHDAWFVKDSSVAEVTETGDISQIFKVDFVDGKSVDVINFSTTDIDSDKIKQMQEALRSMFNKTGGNLTDALRGIAILPADRFTGTNLAAATIGSGAIKINEVLLSDEMMADLERVHGVEHNTLGAESSFQATLTHEMMHLVEGLQSGYGNNVYGDRLGWTGPEVHNFVDDYGNVVSKTKSKLYNPDKNQYVLNEAGEEVEVDVIDEFGRDVYQTAKPITNYGHTDRREDLAEASVAYFYDPGSLDGIRSNAIDNIFTEIKGDIDEIESVVVNEVMLKDFSRQITVKPRDIGVLISYRKQKQDNAAQSPDAYTIANSSLGVVDDYGDVIERTKHRQPSSR